MDPIKKMHADLARRHRRPPVSLQEKLVAVTAALAMAAPPWLLGSMTWWAQSILLALCAICFLVALWPVSNYEFQITNSKSTANDPRSHERSYASSPHHPTVRPSDSSTVPPNSDLRPPALPSLLDRADLSRLY